MVALAERLRCVTDTTGQLDKACTWPLAFKIPGVHLVNQQDPDDNWSHNLLMLSSKYHHGQLRIYPD